MTHSKSILIVNALKSLTSYSIGQFSIDQTKDFIFIRSTKNGIIKDTFHNTECIVLCDAFSVACFLSYNDELNCVELVIC